MRRPLRAVVLVLPAIWLAGCSVFGIRSGYEQPPYDVVRSLDEATEIRRYQPRVAAQLSLDAEDPAASDDAAFRILAGYIFGDNRGSREIAMTSPVAVEEGDAIAMTAPVESGSSGDGRYAMRFFLPSEFTVADAPQPVDPRIEIVEVPAMLVAAASAALAGRRASRGRRRR